jgi:hypothetical protein
MSPFERWKQGLERGWLRGGGSIIMAEHEPVAILAQAQTRNAVGGQKADALPRPVRP